MIGKLFKFMSSLRHLPATHNLTRDNIRRLQALTEMVNSLPLETEFISSTATDMSGGAPKIPKLKVLRTENFHLNERNFKSLLDAIAEPTCTVKLAIDKDSNLKPLLLACGNYDEHMSRLARFHDQIKRLDRDELLDFKYKGVRVFEAAYSEALSACIASDHWQSRAINKTPDAIIDHFFAHDEHLEVLRKCCAAAMFWTNFWVNHRKNFKENIYTYDAALIFSGAFIYGAVLIQLLSHRRGRCFVCEGFITGEDYFFEESYHPVPNGSRIGFSTVLNSYYAKISDKDALDRHRAEAIDRLRHMRNKNVTQPAPEPLPPQLKGRSVTLVVGQVVNDFSLISGQGSVLCSIPAYRALFERILENPDAMIVFKGHPWERKKTNIRSDFTKERLEQFVQSLPAEQRSRVWIVSDWNIKQLLRVSRYVVTICSQAAIEAAMEGIKPITIGGTYYGTGGFSHNFATPELAGAAIRDDAVNPELSLAEYAGFEQFMVAMFTQHLVSNQSVGQNSVLSKLRPIQRYARKPFGGIETSIAPTYDLSQLRLNGSVEIS